ncbi:lanthionine synthetase C family protein [Streptomyces sp. NPDC059455]|uniref:lanthionine synthetase C family protein n=1 Tax=Streptomyces sp. NPDC059455 TaxID=3346837 RepID=UPI0036AB4AB8
MNIPTTGPAPSPEDTHALATQTAHSQSLADGAAGIALWHIERAHRGQGPQSKAHAILATCVNDLITDDNAALYFGAPAVAFALHTASTGNGRYAKALHALDTQITQLTQRRTQAAHARIDRGERPHAREYDLFYGLTGLASYLLCRDRDSQTLRETLAYLVRLTLPLDGDEEQLPGWWTPFDPTGHRSEKFPGGHANLGMAHGISGVLSLLAIAARQGCVVDGQTMAIQRICDWLDLQRQDTEISPWWPQWITLADHRTGAVTQSGPLRPSWCYGTPGLARAQQLAALALGDAERQRMAEHALLSCLADSAQLAHIRDAGICHGAAGLLHTVHRVAQDAAVAGFENHLSRLHALVLEQELPEDSGFLNGTAGRALALMTAESNGAVASGWDACLLSG